MRVLIACEISGVVRDEFRKLGHQAYSCDLLPSSSPYHIQGDAIKVSKGRKWDMVIAHPPCRFLSVSGMHWNARRPGRAQETEKAARFFMAFTRLDVPRLLIENPVCIMSTRWRKPDQIIQPYEFGEDASKKPAFGYADCPRLIPLNVLKDAWWNGPLGAVV